jgi:SAM-dependent methyltransferase
VDHPVSSAQWWNERYLAGDTGWDKGTAAPPIARMISEGMVPKGRVAALGAGRGHEALKLAKAGYAVTAIDFAQAACDAIRETARRERVEIDVLQADVFELPSQLRFDAVLEHTCFCAIDPTRRDEYVRVMTQLLDPGGRLFGLFYAHGRAGGPPFTTSEAEVREKFGPAFEFERLRVAPDSFPGRADEELEFIFRRR